MPIFENFQGEKMEQKPDWMDEFDKPFAINSPLEAAMICLGGTTTDIKYIKAQEYLVDFVCKSKFVDINHLCRQFVMTNQNIGIGNTHIKRYLNNFNKIIEKERIRLGKNKMLLPCDNKSFYMTRDGDLGFKSAIWAENSWVAIEKARCEIKELEDKIKMIDKSENNKTISIIKQNMKTYQQKILFGSPGTGKSYQIDKHIIPYELLIDVEKMPANVIKTVFHPEYTYGDFVGKLMPITVGGNVQYKFYEGHFLKALSQAYKNIIAAQDNDNDCEKVALVIDEINRGNSAAIFGTIFQLLDRNPDGWSSYEVSVNEIIFNRLFELCDLKEKTTEHGKPTSFTFGGSQTILTDELQKKLNCNFENRTIKIPPNLSILASMNTSDSSIYYMDSAFKRRWEWEFIDVDSNPVLADGVAFENRVEWINFVSKLNAFIKSNHKSIRGIEDKQIGHFFITDEQILKSSIQNKLMFFLWDSVFNRDKKPLIDLLFGKDEKHDESPLITFGDFAVLVDEFIDKINNFKNV
jgi:hypothetical protein